MLLGRHISASLALCLMLLPGQALAAPILATAATTETQSVSVHLSQPTPSVTTDSVMRVDVAVSVTAPAEYLEVRLRLRGPAGRLIYQKTEIRSAASAGQSLVEYEYDLEPLDLEQGRYPIEVRVLATDALATTVASRLLVTDRSMSALPVAVVVNASTAPAVSMDGRFVRDPARDSQLRDQIAFVTQLALDRRAPLALAIPPVLLEQYGRVAAGYETTAGVSVAADEETALHAGRMLAALQSAVDTGTIEFVDVPYALPDLTGLARIDGGSDLDLHWARTDAVNATVLRPGAEPVAAYLGPQLTAAGISSAQDRGAECVLVPASAVRSGETTATPGCYAVKDRSVRILVVDEEAAQGARTDAEAFYDALFDRLEDERPVVVMLDIGSGDTNAGTTVLHALDWAEEASWLRVTSIGSLLGDDEPPTASLAPATAGGAPAGYWSDIAASRASTLAYASAVGADDPEAAAATRALLVAESLLWAGGDGRWASADGGRALARQAHDFVTEEFSLIRLDSKNVTLSGSKGDVPLTLINGTGKQLHLTLHATSAAMVPASPTQDITVQPTQNFLTVPVDLGNTLSDTLDVEVRAGEVSIAQAEVGVRASYIDRLATVLMVIVVLGGLLVFIRRRVMSPDAGTIVGGAPRHDRATGSE